MNLTTDADPVVHWAKSTAGITYVFPIQRFVIAGMLDALAKKVDEDDDSKKGLIAVMPTGSGKTLCFQAAIALDGRPALVLYPLLALLEDQKRRFDELGIAAAVLRGGQSLQERNDLWAAVQCGKIKVVLSNPEAMLQAKTLEQAAKTGFAHLIVDESHCVCEWGKTFRPSYLQIPEIQRAANILLLSAFTATAGPEVLSTIQQYLFPECSPYVISGNPDRPNMTLRVMGCVNKEATIRQIFFDQHPNNMIDTEEVYMWRPGTALPRPAIVFCSSRKACEILCKILESDHPGKVLFYHAGLDREEKTRREKWFFDSSDGILVSTTAYGIP